MEYNDVVAGIAAIFSGISVIVSIRAIRQSKEANEQAVEANRRLIEIEEQRDQRTDLENTRAQLRAKFLAKPKRGSRTDNFLIVENVGDGHARNVRVLLDDKPLTEHSVIGRGTQEKTSIGPKPSEHRYRLVLTNTTQRPTRISIDWVSENGEEGHFESEL